MNDLFLNYMSNRFLTKEGKNNVPGQKTTPGPVITISRETGCGGTAISKKLYEKILQNFFKEKANPGPWQVIDKEVLHIAAKALEVNPIELNYVFKGVEKTILTEALESLSLKYYHNDRQVKRIIHNVIRGIAESGHVIFLGRGSVAVTRDMQNALHVRLIAPLDWRIKQVSARLNMPAKKAEEYIKESDIRRIKLIENFGGKFDSAMFDVIYNTGTLTEEEVVDQIFTLAKLKGFFK